MYLQQINAYGEKTNNFQYAGDEIKRGPSLCFKDLDCWDMLMACSSTVVCDAQDAYMLSQEVKIKCIVYKAGVVLLNTWNVMDLPEFVLISKIVVHIANKYFICHKLEVREFDEHLNSFDVLETNQRSVITCSQLYCSWPQIVHKSNGCMYVMLHCTDVVWSL